MRLARRARAKPDTGLSGNGAAGQPADSWSRSFSAFGPSWVCRSPCVPRLPAPLLPTLYGGGYTSLVSTCDPRALQGFSASDAAPSGPLISLGFLGGALCRPRPGREPQRPSRTGGRPRRDAPSSAPGPPSAGPGASNRLGEDRSASLRTPSRLSLWSAHRLLVTHLAGRGVSHSSSSPS